MKTIDPAMDMDNKIVPNVTLAGPTSFSLVIGRVDECQRLKLSK